MNQIVELDFEPESTIRLSRTACRLVVTWWCWAFLLSDCDHTMFSKLGCVMIIAVTPLSMAAAITTKAFIRHTKTISLHGHSCADVTSGALRQWLASELHWSLSLA